MAFIIIFFFSLVYVDASDLCNELVFQMCSGGTVSRNWNIKVFSYVFFSNSLKKSENE